MAKDGDDPAGLASELLAKTREYLPAKGVSLVEEAYAFAGECHAGQLRLAGAPVIIHPLHAALTVADLQQDAGAVAAALLHDVQEDCGVENGTLSKRFGADVAKLADRLHNMRTLWPLPPADQQRISLETREIYAPLAGRLGIWQLKWQLDDLAFRYLEPEPYFQIAEMLDARRSGRERDGGQGESVVRRELAKHGVANADVRGRGEQVYSGP